MSMKRMKGVKDVTQGAGYVPVNFYASIGAEDTNTIQVDIKTADVFGNDVDGDPRIIDMYLTDSDGDIETVVSASGVTDFGIISSSECTEMNTDISSGSLAALQIFAPAGQEDISVEIVCDTASTKNIWMKADDLLSTEDITFTT